MTARSRPVRHTNCALCLSALAAVTLAVSPVAAAKHGAGAVSDEGPLLATSSGGGPLRSARAFCRRANSDMAPRRDRERASAPGPRRIDTTRFPRSAQEPYAAPMVVQSPPPAPEVKRSRNPLAGKISLSPFPGQKAKAPVDDGRHAMADPGANRKPSRWNPFARGEKTPAPSIPNPTPPPSMGDRFRSMIGSDAAEPEEAPLYLDAESRSTPFGGPTCASGSDTARVALALVRQIGGNNRPPFGALFLRGLSPEGPHMTSHFARFIRCSSGRGERFCAYPLWC